MPHATQSILGFLEDRFAGLDRGRTASQPQDRQRQQQQVQEVDGNEHGGARDAEGKSEPAEREPERVDGKGVRQGPKKAPEIKGREGNDDIDVHACDERDLVERIDYLEAEPEGHAIADKDHAPIARHEPESPLRGILLESVPHIHALLISPGSTKSSTAEATTWRGWLISETRLKPLRLKVALNGTAWCKVLLGCIR